MVVPGCQLRPRGHRAGRGGTDIAVAIGCSAVDTDDGTAVHDLANTLPFADPAAAVAEGSNQETETAASATQTNGTLKLPVEIWLLVFGLLDLTGLLTVGSVCRLWYCASSDSRLWRRLCMLANVIEDKKQESLIQDLSSNKSQTPATDWKRRYIEFHKRRRHDRAINELLWGFPRASPSDHMASILRNGSGIRIPGQSLLHLDRCEQCARERQFWEPTSDTSLSPRSPSSPLSTSPMSLSSSPSPVISLDTFPRSFSNQRASYVTASSAGSSLSQIHSVAGMSSGHSVPDYGSMSLPGAGLVASYVHRLSVHDRPHLQLQGDPVRPSTQTNGYDTDGESGSAQGRASASGRGHVGSRASFLLHTLQDGCDWAPENKELLRVAGHAGHQISATVGTLLGNRAGHMIETLVQSSQAWHAGRQSHRRAHTMDEYEHGRNERGKGWGEEGGRDDGDDQDDDDDGDAGEYDDHGPGRRLYSFSGGSTSVRRLFKSQPVSIVRHAPVPDKFMLPVWTSRGSQPTASSLSAALSSLVLMQRDA
ncbi:hypothetical protein BC831DRAFT_494078 [Entophlyctis helioformis]|nr:hypothetical protein BC831DRAFT_494078 [Entophlyctis helioformis]